MENNVSPSPRWICEDPSREMLQFFEEETIRKNLYHLGSVLEEVGSEGNSDLIISALDLDVMDKSWLEEPKGIQYTTEDGQKYAHVVISDEQYQQLDELRNVAESLRDSLENVVKAISELEGVVTSQSDFEKEQASCAARWPDNAEQSTTATAGVSGN